MAESADYLHGDYMIQDFIPDTHSFYLETDTASNKALRVVLIAKSEALPTATMHYVAITEAEGIEYIWNNEKYANLGWNHAAMHYVQWGSIERMYGNGNKSGQSEKEGRAESSEDSGTS